MRFMTRRITSSLLNAMIASVFLPLLFSCTLAGFVLVQQVNTYIEARYLQKKMDLVGVLGTLVHEQQKERGGTSIFIASGGTAFATELRAQRALTDAAANTLLNRIADLSAAGMEAGLQGRIDALMPALRQRELIRSRVDALDIEAPEALAHYTQHNAEVIATISHIGSITFDPRIATTVFAVEALVNAKELAGLERAQGSAGFASGGFDFGRTMTLQRLIAQQDYSLLLFSRLADEAASEQFRAIEALPQTAEVARMRQIAFDNHQGASLDGISGEQFFGATTVRIDAFKALEDRMVLQVSDLSTAKYLEARGLIIGLLVGLFATVCAATAVTWFSTRNMLRSVRSIADAGDKLSKGNESALLPTEVPTELGRIVFSINRFRESVAAAREREAAVVAERNRSEEEARTAQAERQQLENRHAAEEAAAAKAEQQRMQDYAKEMSAVVNACAKGDFSQRLSVDGSDGILAELSGGLNLISDGVAQSLEEIKRALSHIAEGDMTYRMNGTFQGVFDEIATAMTEATDNMARTLSRVMQATGSVSSSTAEISAATDDLAKRSDKNANMLQQTAAAVEEMSASIRSAAEAARTAKGHLGEVSERVVNGNKIAEGTIAAMGEIRESSEGISKILAVIDDIAFQTNLLALNAGVEAARAGDAGRGFAVVASEVRSLAQRSTQYGQEIGKLIEASKTSIERGVKMVDQTASSLDEIKSDIETVSSQFEHMSGSFDETRRGIEEVANAAAHLDKTTQQNAAMFEETNAAIQILDSETRSLMDEIGAFKTSHSPGSATYRHPVASNTDQGARKRA